LRNPSQLGADQEGIDPTGSGAEMRVVQDHPPQTPVVGVPVPRHPLIVDVEVGRLRPLKKAVTCVAAAADLSGLPA
jgi:hypothetical protein